MGKVKKVVKSKRVRKIVAISGASLLIFCVTGYCVSPYVWGFTGVKAIVKKVRS
jgi:hypothetical protein